MCMMLLLTSRLSLEVFGTCPDICHLIFYIDPDAEAQREDGGADGRAADIGGEQGEGLLLLRGSAAPLREHARITPTRID